MMKACWVSPVSFILFIMELYSASLIRMVIALFLFRFIFFDFMIGHFLSTMVGLFWLVIWIVDMGSQGAEAPGKLGNRKVPGRNGLPFCETCLSFGEGLTRDVSPKRRDHSGACSSSFNLLSSSSLGSIFICRSGLLAFFQSEGLNFFPEVL